MHISEYIKLNNISRVAFAKLLRTSPQNLERYINKKRIPKNKDLMRRLVEITNGQVTPNDFYDLKTD